MAIAYESASSDFVSGDGDASLAPAKPSGLAAGDVILGLGGCVSSRTIAPPAGWTQVDTHDDGSRRVTVWTRTADAGDAAASAFAFAVSGGFSNAGVVLFRLSGATESGAVSAAGTGANDVTVACPDVTPPAANGLVVWGFWQPNVGLAATSSRGTERVDADGADNHFSAYTEAVASSSLQSGATITKSAYGVPLPFAAAVGPSGGGDTTAPVLTSPVGTATGSTTATTGATTDEGNGTLYAVVTTSNTQPSVAQIKAGQDHTGASAAFGGSTSVGSTGAKTINATGLAASTAYYAHLVHTDAATNDSNRVTSAQFTTDAAPTLTAGTATFVSSGPAGITVEAAAPTSGSGSGPTYQWERNEDGGGYADLTGETSLTCEDDTATGAGVLYGYRCKQTRGVDTVTTNAVTAEVYDGGALVGGTAGTFVGSAYVC